MIKYNGILHDADTKFFFQNNKYIFQWLFTKLFIYLFYLQNNGLKTSLLEHCPENLQNNADMTLLFLSTITFPTMVLKKLKAVKTKQQNVYTFFYIF